MRDRLTGRHVALNAEMLVRIQLLQLRHWPLRSSSRSTVNQRPAVTTEVNRLDEEPVLKTGNGRKSVVGSSPAASAPRCSIGPVAWRRRQLPYKETIGGSSPPGTTFILRHRSPTAEAVVSKAMKCEFESHRCHSQFTTRPCRAARSARHPVTMEIVGSNPIGSAFHKRNERIWRGSPMQRQPV